MKSNKLQVKVASLLVVTVSVTTLQLLPAQAAEVTSGSSVEQSVESPTTDTEDNTYKLPNQSSASTLAEELAPTGTNSHEVETNTNNHLILKVVGGSNALISDAPWQVALLNASASTQSRGLFCGGSIIREKWILTAAHCVTGKTPQGIRVLAGSNTLSTANNSGLPVARIVVHPSYSASTEENDIALLELSSPIAPNNSSTSVIPLTASKPSSGSAALVTGWGSTSSTYGSATPSYPLTLQKATVFVKSDAYCSQDVGAGFRTGSMICAMTDLWMIDTCQGDSGGPLAVSENGAWVLAGITSWGIGCADLNAGVYTNVANYIIWIRSQLPGIEGVTPAIEGSTVPKVGVPLRASVGSWRPSGVALAFQWIIDGVIVGTDQSYVPSAPDLGKQVSLTVIGTLPNYETVSLTSNLTNAISAGALSSTPLPSLSGTRSVGQTLTASPGAWDAGVSLSYQWFRGTTAIAGATESTYPLTGADFNTAISVRVTGEKTGYTTVTKASAATARIALGALTLTPTPSVSGTPQVEQRLTAEPGTWDTGTTLKYQWFRGTTAIAGATESTYPLTGADFNTAISVRVTGEKTGYTTVTKASAATARIALGALTLTPTPSVSGTPQVEQRLTAEPGTWDTGTTLKYQWFRGTTAIAGATASTYTLTVSDFNSLITVRVTGTKTGYSAVTQASATPEAAILAGAPRLSPIPSISGQTTVGQLLTAIPGTWDAGTTVRYQWFRGEDAIEGAIAATYTLTSNDLDNTISVIVTGTKIGYSTVTRPSALTARVSLGSFSSTPTPKILGTLRIGSIVRVSLGTWSPSPNFEYQWTRNGVDIPGANNPAMTLTALDAGQSIAVRVTASNHGFNSTSRTSAQTSSWTRVTKSATYTAYSVFTPCRSLGNSFQPCDDGSWLVGSGGVRLYSSGGGDVMSVAASIPMEGAVQRWRVQFQGSTKYSSSGYTFTYSATGVNPSNTDSWHSSYVFPYGDFRQQNFTTPWSTTVSNDAANFVIGSLGWHSLYIRYVKIEYETIL